jgi:hypothetical protein
LNSAQLDRLTRSAQKEVVRKTKEPPVVEEISPSEIYLLKDNHRLKRICGHTDEYGWPCTISAGHDTLHEGEGRCKKHEGRETGKKEYLDRYLNVLSNNKRLQKYFTVAHEADKDAYSADALLKLIYAMLLEHLNEAQYNWNKKEAFFVLTLVEQMRKMIETNSKVEVQKVMASGIIAWLRAVLIVIQNSVSIDTFGKIREQILSIKPPIEIEDVEFKET